MKRILMIFVLAAFAACGTRQDPSASAPSQGVRGGDQVVCIQDAKQCPDGRWVGRSGPRCEFDCSPPAKY